MTTPERIRIATWNCFGAPNDADDLLAGTCFWPERIEAQAVADALGRYDLVCIQENFVPRVRQSLTLLQQAARFEHLWFDPMEPDYEDGTFMGGGLAFLSRFPLDARFTRLPRGAGPDGFARKGFAVADVRLPSGREVHVINTHLQADDPSVTLDECRAARAAQLEGLASAIDGYRASGAPLVVCGDFNVVHGTDEYAALRRRLGDELVDLAGRAGFRTYDTEQNDLARAFLDEPAGAFQLDYIWIRSGRFDPSDLHLVLDQPIAELDGRPARYAARPFASDHYGVGATLDLMT
jgi:endonuclease/exonuclease/phosphatase family metal-dependent hydrolase